MNALMLTPQESALLRALLAREAPSAPAPEASDELAAGDVAQIRPCSDAAFGGMLYQVCQVTPYELRGFLLRPHRGGCRDAWLKMKHCELERVGRTWWPDSSNFARRCSWRAPECQVTRSKL